MAAGSGVRSDAAGKTLHVARVLCASATKKNPLHRVARACKVQSQCLPRDIFVRPIFALSCGRISLTPCRGTAAVVACRDGPSSKPRSVSQLYRLWKTADLRDPRACCGSACDIGDAVRCAGGDRGGHLLHSLCPAGVAARRLLKVGGCREFSHCALKGADVSI